MRWDLGSDDGIMIMHASLASLRTILASLLFSIQFYAPSSGESYANYTYNIAIFLAAVVKTFRIVVPAVYSLEDTANRTVTRVLKKTRPHCLSILTSWTQNNASFH